MFTLPFRTDPVKVDRDHPDGGVVVTIRIPKPPPIPAGYSVDGWSWASAGPMPAHVQPVTLQEEVRAWLTHLVNRLCPLSLRAMNEDGEAVGTSFDLETGAWDSWADHVPCDGEGD